MVQCITAESTRERVRAALHVIDDALGTLRDTPTDAVGNAFRVEVAERLETQRRTVAGVSYRLFAELHDPPDGPDPSMIEDASLRDVLRARLADHRRRNPATRPRRRPNSVAALADRAAAGRRTRDAR